MIAKVRFLANNSVYFTQNQEYLVLAWENDGGVALANDNVPRGFGSISGGEWEIVSITAVGAVQLFP